VENQQFVSPSRQCSSTPVGLVKDFLAKNNVTTLKHPPHSPDLAPADFYLFPRLESALKGQGFCDATDIIRNADENGTSLEGVYFLPLLLSSSVLVIITAACVFYFISTAEPAFFQYGIHLGLTDFDVTTLFSMLHLTCST